MESNTARPLEGNQKPVERRVSISKLLVSVCPEPQNANMAPAQKSGPRNVLPERIEDGKANDDDDVVEITDGMGCTANETLRRIDRWDDEKVVIDAAPVKPNEVVIRVIAATRNLMAGYIKAHRRLFKIVKAKYKKPPFDTEEAF
jgi:hypothetical protein